MCVRVRCACAAVYNQPHGSGRTVPVCCVCSMFGTCVLHLCQSSYASTHTSTHRRLQPRLQRYVNHCLCSCRRRRRRRHLWVMQPDSGPVASQPFAAALETPPSRSTAGLLPDRGTVQAYLSQHTSTAEHLHHNAHVSRHLPQQPKARPQHTRGRNGVDDCREVVHLRERNTVCTTHA